LIRIKVLTCLELNKFKNKHTKTVLRIILGGQLWFRNSRLPEVCGKPVTLKSAHVSTFAVRA